MWFVDTNVFFYSSDDRLPELQQKARLWLTNLATRRLGKANLQVANELTNVILKKLPAFPAIEAFDMANDIMAWGSEPITSDTTLAARRIRQRYHYSWWDCVLLASALDLGCTHFLSEDLNDGQRIEQGGKSLTIVDPFAHSPEHFLS